MKSETVTLYYKQGKSDKVYTVSLEEAETDFFTVNFAYGRRGGTLKTGTKTKNPISYESAKKTYDKLVKSKKAKGYKPGEDGPEYVHTDSDTRDTGIYCQLLNFIEKSQVDGYIRDDKWWAQEKHDGKRMLLRKTDEVTAINRSGLSVGAPDVILKKAGSLDHSFVVDGEAVGETLHLFDMLEAGNTDLRPLPYEERLAHLEKTGFESPVIVVETAKTTEEKQALYDRLNASGCEGIVFKKHASPYSAGRPNSGGDQVKFKFYATASVLVTRANKKRSVAIAVFEKEERIDVGNVSIPQNKKVPPPDSVIEVRYLYAYPGGSLFQPVYIGLRDDVGIEACLISQLKYKKE